MTSSLEIYRRFAYHFIWARARGARPQLRFLGDKASEERRGGGADRAADEATNFGVVPDSTSVVSASVTADDTAGSTNSDLWGELAERQAAAQSLGWLDNGWLVQRYVFPKVFGRPVSDRWGLNAVEAFGIPRGGRWLSLGCGSAGIEVQMAEDDLFETMVALDASSGAIDVARREAKRRGVDHKCQFDTADLNTLELQPETFDVVHMNMALHHVHALERLVCQINRALVDGGVFLANEFVGCNQFQFPYERLEMVRRRLSALPERLRWNPVAHELKTEYPRYPRRHWNEYDPTESVRSDEIPHVLRINFPNLRRYDYGGPILNLVLENIIPNFDLDSPEVRGYLEELFAYEQALIRTGVLCSEFAYFVCPRGPRWARARGALAARFDVRHRATMALRASALD